ncbi:unnamed protein product [Closterium sp. NIES-53]
MYLMTCTRPDLAYPLGLLARYVAPGRHRKVHMDAAKRVLRYLCSTSGMGLVLGGRGDVVLTGLGRLLVSWRSTRSSSILGSSCEAEIYATAMAAQELRWLTYLLTNLGERPRSPPVLYVDNKAAIALCQEHRLEHRTKHIALRYFLARELQQRGQLRLTYVATRANTSDIFTKALPPGDHQRFCTLLGLVPTLPRLLVDDVVLTGHSDASWVDDQATQRSSQGYTFSLGSGLVSWRSTRSSSILGSSCEAEIYATAMAAQELRWLTYLLTNLGERPRSPPVLYVDNKAAIALCQEHRLEHRTKHIALRYFLARELQQRGQLRLTYVATRANTSDIFTKALPPGDHQRFCTLLGLVPTLPRLLLRGPHRVTPWVDDQATQRSSQGYTFSLGSGSVSWRSTRSSSVLSSSCEAEIYATAMAAQELRWLTYLLTDLGERPRSPPVLYVDNKAAIALCQEHRLEHRTKHIALRYFLARELQQRGQLRLTYVATQSNTADIFTKALLSACFTFPVWPCDPLFSPTLPMGVC